LEIWKFGNLEIWKFGKLEIFKYKKCRQSNISIKFEQKKNRLFILKNHPKYFLAKAQKGVLIYLFI
jgi:hypothetical protein